MEGAVTQGTECLGDQPVAFGGWMRKLVRADQTLGKRTFVRLWSVERFSDIRAKSAVLFGRRVAPPQHRCSTGRSWTTNLGRACPAGIGTVEPDVLRTAASFFTRNEGVRGSNPRVGFFQNEAFDAAVA
jgi:hypothetical protein